MNRTRLIWVACAAILAAACTTAPVATTPQTTAAQPHAPDVTGAWTLTTRSHVGSEDAEMIVHQHGDVLSGTLTGRAGTVPLNGRVEGTAIAFDFTIDPQGQAIRIDYTGAIESADTMTGRAVFGRFGEGTFVARRKSSPDRK